MVTFCSIALINLAWVWDARARNGWQDGGWQSVRGSAIHPAAGSPGDQGHNGSKSRMKGASGCSSSRAEIQSSSRVSSGPGHTLPPEQRPLPC